MNALDDLCDYFERLSADNLDELDTFYAQGACFKDPFHEVTGVDAIRAILRHTFAKLPGARFRVIHRFPDADQHDVDQHGADRHAMIVWEMDFIMPLTHQPATIAGSTHLVFDGKGKITQHRDYWDAAEELYARLPVLKWLMRGLARQAAAPL